MFSNPTLSHDGRLLFTGSGDHFVYAYAAPNQTQPQPAPLWRADAGGAVASFSVLSPDERALYVGVHDGNVLKMRTRDGAVLWNFTGTPGVQVQSDQVLSRDGTVLYIGRFE